MSADSQVRENRLALLRSIISHKGLGYANRPVDDRDVWEAEAAIKAIEAGDWPGETEREQLYRITGIGSTRGWSSR